jgi:(1->4)-alpha-D-glucan 1-alpha-D-glucosylmutase
MQVSMSGEGNMLAHQLNNLSEEDRRTRDFTLNSLARAIGEVIACFPVYRTYANSASVRDRDIQYIELAVSKAKRKNPAVNASIFDFVRDVLLLRCPTQASEDACMAWLAFAMRFQQITGPVTAKGLEDTAFYVYNRLVSLNEVGGMPGRFGTTLEAFHGQNLDRVKTFPHGMIATATHDSKRGEDVRTRIDALSELPELWQKSVARWRRMNRSKRGLLEGLTVPDRNEEYLLYQILIGAWPAAEPDREGYGRFCNRIKEYMIKAIREAKVNTSWVSPNGPYEEAVVSFVDQILCDPDGNPFLRDFLRLQKRVARWGMFTSLSQVLLKMTSPGMPDFYQGSELWEFSLVDPDNRHPVHYGIRKEALAAVKAREAEVGAKAVFSELLEHDADGRVKLYLIYRVLNFRKANRVLFDQGDYHPLEAREAKSRHVCAFSRSAQGRSMIAVVPRLLAGLVPEEGGAPMGEVWSDTVLLLPEGSGRRFRNVVNDDEVEAVERDGELALPLAQVLAAAPVALLEAVG